MFHKIQISHDDLQGKKSFITYIRDPVYVTLSWNSVARNAKNQNSHVAGGGLFIDIVAFFGELILDKFFSFHITKKAMMYILQEILLKEV